MTGRRSTIRNSNVGREAISQVISALEHWRFNHAHLYRGIADAQTPLRSDSRVRTIEAAKKHDEPKRVESSQALKAAGTSSGQFFPPACWTCTMLMATFLETHTQRQSLCAVPPGASNSSLDHSTFMLVCGMQPCSFSPPQQLCAVAALGSSVGLICLCLTSPWMTSVLGGRCR
jgi:hypothetical protein